MSVSVEQQARKSLAQLVAYVLEHQDGLIAGITYQELARRIGRLDRYGEGHARGMGKVLGEVGQLLSSVEGEWGESIPYIQSLVVLKSGPLEGLPSYGVDGFWPGYSEMSKPEKLNKVKAEHKDVVTFGSRWNRILEALGVPKVEPPGDGTGGRPGDKPRGNGQESVEHRALKKHVLRNPEVVGAGEGWEGVPEYPLPTLDEVDVLFRSATGCVAVEVKSRKSDEYPSDYERGIYQTVKYGALLRAMSRDNRYDIPADVRSVLVLESRLPEQYAEAADALGVEVIEHVRVEED